MRKSDTSLLAGVLILALMGAAKAQSPEICARIDSDLERLICYDQIFRTPPNASSSKTDRESFSSKTGKGDRSDGGFAPNVSAKSGKSEPIGTQKPAAKKSDAPTLNDWDSQISGKNVVLTTRSRKTLRNIVGQSSPLSLIITCRGNVTSLSVRFGGNIVSSVLDEVPVTLLIDGDKKLARTFEVAQDFKAVGLWSGGASIPTVKALIGVRELKLTGAPFFSKKVTAAFDVRGLAEAIKPLRQSCGW